MCLCIHVSKGACAIVEVPHGILHLVTENLVRTGSPKYDRDIAMGGFRMLGMIPLDSW